MCTTEEADELLDIAYQIEDENPTITAEELLAYMIDNEVHNPYEALRYLLTN